MNQQVTEGLEDLTGLQDLDRLEGLSSLDSLLPGINELPEIELREEVLEEALVRAVIADAVAPVTPSGKLSGVYGQVTPYARPSRSFPAVDEEPAPSSRVPHIAPPSIPDVALPALLRAEAQTSSSPPRRKISHATLRAEVESSGPRSSSVPSAPISRPGTIMEPHGPETTPSRTSVPAARPSDPGPTSARPEVRKVRTVLLISDDKQAITDLTRLLSATDAQLVAAKTPNEACLALDLSAIDRPTAVIMIDALVHSKVGAQLVAQLRRSTASVGVRIVVLSALSTQTLEEMRREWGADDYLATNRGLLHMSTALRGWLDGPRPSA